MDTAGWQVHRGRLDGRPLRRWTGGPAGSAREAGPAGVALVFVPGLGAPRYLHRWARAAARRVPVAVLDLPGWRRGRAAACPPTVSGVAAAVAAWLEGPDAPAGDVVVVGHSTGAQAVARVGAALDAPLPARLAGVVLAGPTFDPAARRVGPLLRRGAATLARERPVEPAMVVPAYLASGLLPLARMLRDGLADHVEDAVARLQVPALVLTGRHDGFAPPDWAVRLAAVAGTGAVVLPGAHNACVPYPLAHDAAVRAWAAGLPLRPRRPSGPSSAAPAPPR